VLKELTDFQSTLLDEAGTYTKIIMGLGYGGFFAGWSGSKAYLPPKLLLASALLMTISLVLYILFEICQTTILSYLSIEFANATNKADADPMKALAAFKKRASRLTSRLLTAWKFVFPLTS
ncbi:MAG: hypothetical protein ACRD5G_12535, partial [Candidatus Acidiferrales bacterium]